MSEDAFTAAYRADMWRVDVAGYPVCVKGQVAREHLEQVKRIASASASALATRSTRGIPMDITWTTKGHGWTGSFPDQLEDTCTIRKDSIDSGAPFVILGNPKGPMHLDREAAGKLAFVLLKFHFLGELP